MIELTTSSSGVLPRGDADMLTHPLSPKLGCALLVSLLGALLLMGSTRARAAQGVVTNINVRYDKTAGCGRAVWKVTVPAKSHMIAYVSPQTSTTFDIRLSLWWYDAKGGLHKGDETSAGQANQGRIEYSNGANVAIRCDIEIRLHNREYWKKHSAITALCKATF
jgi:hypothetical protein